MFKILTLVILGSSIGYAFHVFSKPEKKSKTAILISQAEQSILTAQNSMNNAKLSLKKIQAKKD